MGALRGDLAKLSDFKTKLRSLPKSLAVDVAKRAAPAMTALTKSAFDSGRTVYGEARPQGVNGNDLTLRASGATEAQLKFVAIGTIVRCVLGPRWSKYLIGKYAILPNGRMPALWTKRLDDLIREFATSPANPFRKAA